MAMIDAFRDSVMERAVESIRVASFEAPKATSFQEWKRRIEAILTSFEEDRR